MDEKHNLFEILIKLLKDFKKLLKKIAKLLYFSIFFTKSDKSCVYFFQVWMEMGLLEILRIFSKDSLRKLQKCNILANFPKDLTNLTNHPLIHCAFGRKSQIVGKFWVYFENVWWKFYRKIEFLFSFYFGKFVPKIIANRNNTIFI